MLPTPLPMLQACDRRLRHWRAATTSVVVLAALAVLGSPEQALAGQEPGDETAIAGKIDGAGEGISFEADRVDYSDDSDTVTASGNVVLRRDGQSLRSDSVTWDRKTSQIIASGNIRMVDADGNQLFTEKLELTDEFKAGAMENMLLALREGGRLAATSGTRDEHGDVVLNSAVYSACEVEDSTGCPKTPSWRITARRVIYDAEAKRVRFVGARMEIFGAPLLPLPGLVLATDGRPTSGLLIPDLRITPSNGVEIGESWYQRLGDNRDLTATAYIYTEAPPMIAAQYRALTGAGAYQLTGYATRSSRIPEAGAASETRDFRGYLFANGRFQFSPNWSMTGSARVASDRTFLRRYDISRDDKLRSMLDMERIDDSSYLSLAGWATQTMHIGERQGLVPMALPAIDYRRRLLDPLLGGQIELQANSLAILRTEGQDTQRAFGAVRWDLRRLTGLGQEITLTALARGDVYHSDENAVTSTVIYRGNPGWETRAIAIAAVDMKWPFAGKFAKGIQVLTPRMQITAAPSINNLAVPNEDSRSIDLEDSNLFALNRFPGYDRVEDGARFTYGLDWQFEQPRWRVKTTVGQSYRLTKEPTLLPDGTGISNRLSDIVGRVEVRYRDFVKLTSRFRIDKDNFSFRRNEFDATIGSHRTYAEVGYLRLNRDIAAGLEDLRDREELRVAGRIAFARYWSLFGSGVYNLTDRSEDPSFPADGFQPLRARLGIAYEDDCLELAAMWRRDYATAGDARRGTSFQIRFALRNLGFR